MKEIEVKIDHHDFLESGGTYSDTMFETWCIGKLKEAGIPIMGTFIFEGVKSGQLIRRYDPESETTTYLWIKK